MFQFSPTPLLIVAPDAPRFTIIEVNDAYLAATMRARPDLIGRAMFEAFPDNPDDPDATGVRNLRASLERALVSKHPDAMQRQKYDIPKPDGGFEERWWDPINTPVLNDQGTVEALIHHVKDVTGEERTQAALRESEARLRAAILASPFPMMLHAEDGEVIELSRKWTELTGYRREEIRTHHDWSRLAYPGGLDRFDKQIAAEFASEGETAAGEWEVNTKDGSSRVWDFHNVGVGRLPDGRRLQVSAAADITARKHAESALRDLNETLERRVAERTAELEQVHEQLRHSQKLEAMGQLTGGVSHDFNNLLTPIIGALDLLQRSNIAGQREQRLLEGALQAAERAKTLVQRLLAFSRRQPLQPRPVDITALVAGMAEIVTSTVGPTIRVIIDIDEDLPAAVAEPTQVEMALLNLSVNARDAMPEGGTLRITVQPASIATGHPSKLTPGRYLRLSVSDTGVGMDEATLRRSVEPFFSTKGIGRGTGLGLSMVHGVAAQLGGALTIQSRVGQGTEVEIWLPFSTEAAPRPEGHSTDERLSRVGTVLLVDDEDLVRSSTADMLGELGYKVVEAETAESALHLIDGGLKFDILVTDHLMAGMTGTELAKLVRVHHPDLPTLVVSGYADVDGIAPNLPRLAKPFRQAELASKLAEISIVVPS